MRPTAPRSPQTPAGPPHPEPPFPIPLSGPIVKGFGRGSAELGIPTANIPLAGLSVGGHEELESGVYYGWVGVGVDGFGRRLGKDEREKGKEKRGGSGDDDDDDGVTETVPGGSVYQMVMSLGYNPYYKNTVRSIEVHVLHSFKQDFYGARMNLLICGFIRPEYDYVSKESLVEDIRVDIQVAARSLEREGYRALLNDEALFGGLVDFTPVEGGKVEEGAAKTKGEVDGKL